MPSSKSSRGQGGRRTRSGGDAGADAGLFASREYSTAVVLLHAAVAERFGLGVTELKTLDVLQRVGRMTAGDLAGHTRLATASVTSLIDRLEHKGLVRRVRDRKDRRRVFVVLTPKLERTIAPLFRSLNRRLRARFDGYTPAEAAAIATFLNASAKDMFVEALNLRNERK